MGAAVTMTVGVDGDAGGFDCAKAWGRNTRDNNDSDINEGMRIGSSRQGV